METKIIIRQMQEEDSIPISRAFAEQGWNKPVSQYIDYFWECQSGKRLVLIAEWDGEFAGYVTIVWESHYPPFREAGIP
jgi:hypothetical protein